MDITKYSQDLLEYLDQNFVSKLVAALTSSTSNNSNNNNKVVVIKGTAAIAAAAAVAVGLFLHKLLRPPAHLRHIPSVNYFKLAYSFLSNEDASSRVNRIIFPTVLENRSKAYLMQFPLQWTIMITDPVAAKAVLLKTDNFPKSLQLLETLDDSHPFVKFIGRSNVAISSGDVWKSQRKIMNSAFHRAMPVSLFGKLMLKVFKIIDEHQGQPVVVIDLMERMTLDALSNGLFAFDFNALEDKNSVWVKTYDSIRLGLRDPKTLLFAKFDFILKRVIPARARISRDIDKLNGLLLSMAEKRREEIKERRAKGIDIPDGEKDLLTLMLEGKLDGVNGVATNEELRSNIATFFLAGHDTTANSLAFAFYHLAVHPDIQEKARQEAISLLGDEPRDVLPTAEQCKQMKYIDMIIKENLRLLGPANNITPRFAVEEMYAGELYIPKDASVSIDLNAIHLHPDLWEKPNEFIPERFQQNTANNVAEPDRHKGLTWLPFSNGGRQCIGMNFSLAEQRVALSMLLRKYEWSLPEDSVHTKGIHIHSFINFAPTSLTIKFKNRY